MLVLTRARADATTHAQVVLADACDVYSSPGESALGERCLDSSTAVGEGYFGWSFFGWPCFGFGPAGLIGSLTYISKHTRLDMAWQVAMVHGVSALYYSVAMATHGRLHILVEPLFITRS